MSETSNPLDQNLYQQSLENDKRIREKEEFDRQQLYIVSSNEYINKFNLLYDQIFDDLKNNKNERLTQTILTQLVENGKYDDKIEIMRLYSFKSIGTMRDYNNYVQWNKGFLFIYLSICLKKKNIWNRHIHHREK